MLYLCALLIGVVAGLRTMSAPTAVAWAASAWVGWISLEGTPLAFLGSTWVVVIFTVLAIGELIADQLPTTPSRKSAPQFAARLISGALAGAAIGATGGLLVAGLAAGIVGAVIGTYAGAAARDALARAFGRDWPAALIEDAVAIGGAALILCCAANAAMP
jgi:uncharacterized membrane protein